MALSKNSCLLISNLFIELASLDERQLMVMPDLSQFDQFFYPIEEVGQ
jgi:hypothetical protein